MQRTRKIVMTVFCLEEDAEDVKRQLFDGENQSGFFYDSNVGLANVKVEVLEPTNEEDRKADDSLDWGPASIKHLYPRGECPKCGYEMDEDTKDGDTCDDCGHKFTDADDIA